MVFGWDRVGGMERERRVMRRACLTIIFLILIPSTQHGPIRWGRRRKTWIWSFLSKLLEHSFQFERELKIRPGPLTARRGAKLCDVRVSCHVRRDFAES